jgi:uncharacterized OB-fold protein
VKDIIDKATLRALAFNADGASEFFYARLMEKRLQSTKCAACELIPYPPRPFCPGCGHQEVTWVELPKRGTLQAFTTQHRSLRFMEPDVLGAVELEGVDGWLLTKIDAPLSALTIGQQVEVDFFEVSPKLTLHQFRPVT